jgi:hypothetical protein
MFINDRVLDLGLNVLDTEADKIFICDAEPTTYAGATSAANGSTQHGLGNKSFGVGAVFGSPAAGTPNGRKVTSNAVTDGSVTTSGTGSHFAVVDSVNSRLLLAGPLAASQALINGNPFTLTAFSFRLPNA